MMNKEMTHELLEVLNSDDVQGSLEEFLVLFGYDESEEK